MGLSDKDIELKTEESTVKSRVLEITSQERRRVSGRSLSLPHVEVMDQKPGWPLLRTTTLATPVVQHQTRKVSVVNWVMSLPERFPNLTSQQSFCDSQLKDILKETNKWFSYDVLKTAASDFSSGTNYLINLFFSILYVTLCASDFCFFLLLQRI